jgi:hypothetical protein
MQKRYRVTLTAAERQELQTSVSTGTAAARKLVRARILLLADQAEGGSAKADAAIVEALGCGRATVERVRPQFVEDGLEQTLRGCSKSPKPLGCQHPSDSQIQVGCYRDTNDGASN